MQAQDLGLERARDHRWRLTSRSPTQRTEPREAHQHTTTDAHLLRAAPATVQPIGLLACLHAPRTQHWTTPRIAGIKATRTRPYARQHVEGPGFFPGTCPGLRFFGVRT